MPALPRSHGSRSCSPCCLPSFPSLAAARLRLAVVVQYIPLPAIGGYLSFVGYFCIASGLGLGCGVELGSLASWLQLWDAQVGGGGRRAEEERARRLGARSPAACLPGPAASR